MVDIEQNGNLGDRVQGYGDNVIYKKRMKNTSKRVGLSGGFRVIECVVRDNKVYLLDIYTLSPIG